MTMQKGPEAPETADDAEKDAPTPETAEATAETVASSAVEKAEEKKESLEEELTRLRKDNQRLKSIEGNQKKRDANADNIDRVVALINQQNAEIRRLRQKNDSFEEDFFEYISNPDAERDPALLRTKRAARTATEQLATENERFAQDIAKAHSRMNARLGKLGLPLEDIQAQPEYKELMAAFTEATKGLPDDGAFNLTRQEIDKRRDALLDAMALNTDLVSALQEKKLEEARADGRMAEREERGLNQTATPRGGGGGGSDQDWLDRYADEVNGDVPATAANAKRAQELQAKGLKPRLRSRR